jgi:radical SAM protein with 4Fe4S-binding SPASM domain
MTQREDLYKKLPLSTPLSIHIFPTYKCNFKCSYCIQALSQEDLINKNFSKDVMDFEVYKKAIDDILEYEYKLKALIFAGHGEPLMHPRIVDMVKYAKSKNIANRIEITTNGVLLKKETSDGLIDAGVDRLKISIQGTSSKKYKEIAKFKLDYDEFLNNLEYFYLNKKNTEVYIKIIDIALDNNADKLKFEKMFERIATYVDIEYAIPFVNEIDHSNIKENFDKCKQGHCIKSDICSMPFYMQVIDPNGNILPCCSTDIPSILGNVKEMSLKESWKSKKMNMFLQTMLKDKNKNPICSKCSVPEYGLQNGDYLDAYKNELLDKYNKISEHI